METLAPCIDPPLIIEYYGCMVVEVSEIEDTS